ncbi:MAG: tRNA 4-thiouridine(8) synthase ThiI, partial [Candidatus Thorarchaeota archaeon]
MKPEYSAVLLRYGEIGIKSSQTRKRMVRLLVKHTKTALKVKEVSFKRVIIEYGRIFIETDFP